MGRRPRRKRLQEGHDVRVRAVVESRPVGALAFERRSPVITYDEFCGVRDHVTPPQGDRLGPGTRIPAIVVLPLVEPGFFDRTPYDTASILRSNARRWGLPTPAGIATRDNASKANGQPAMGDLSNTLQ